MTIGELGLGVEMASEAKERSLRAATLAVAEDRFDVVGFDQATAIEYSRLMGDARLSCPPWIESGPGWQAAD